jgi:hypothetical protein
MLDSDRKLIPNVLIAWLRLRHNDFLIQTGSLEELVVVLSVLDSHLRPLIQLLHFDR